MHQQPTSDTNKNTAEKEETLSGHESKDSKKRDQVWECARFLESWVNTHAQARETREALAHLTTQLDLLVKNASPSSSVSRLFSIKEAAQFLALSERTIRERIALREWPAYRCGKAVRVDPEEIRMRMRNKP